MSIPVRFKGLGSTVLVAVGLDSQTQHLINAATSLCRQTKMSMRLVHVIEPWEGRYWASAATGGIPMMDIISSVEVEQAKSARIELEKLAKTIDSSIDVSTNVLVSTVADGIIADAVGTAATVIMTGAALQYSAFVPRGFSTALSLMAKAPIPVLVVPKTVQPDFEKARFKMLIADDLTQDSDSTALTALDFARVLNNPALEHLHVNSVNAENLQTTFNTVMASSRIPMNPAVDMQMLNKILRETMRQKLDQRLPERRNLLVSQGGTYSASVIDGKPEEEIQRIAKSGDFDLIVFGRHATFHQRPFLIGRVPFHAMLAQDRCVMVAPKI